MKNVMVLFGGQSSEHEVSRVSAKNVIENIDKDKYKVMPVGITKAGEWLPFDGDLALMPTGEWESYAREKIADFRPNIVGISPKNMLLSLAQFFGESDVSIVHPVLHGINGEDGTVQGFLELAEIPYVGPSVLGSSIGMDKEISKIIFEKAGIPQGRYMCVYRHQLSDDKKVAEIIEKVHTYIKFPCFVKPANAGSSVGVGKATDEKELITTLKNAAAYDFKILVEQFINAREIECAVLGNIEPKASVLGEIVASNEFYDYKAKYVDNKSVCVIPAEISADVSQKIRKMACKAFKALQCDGLSRVDFFVEKETGEIFINEINTLPGFTSISMYPMLWKATGIGYIQLLDELYELAIQRMSASKREIDI